MSAFYLTTPDLLRQRPAASRATPAPRSWPTPCAATGGCAGDRVYFLTGTDEHGDKIAQAAAKAGVSPQAYADEIAAAFRDTWRRLGITNDDFIRTTEPRHKAVVQAILQKLYDAGEIYFGEYGGCYCFGCERFYTEKEIVDGKCPDHQIAAHLHQGEELLLPDVEVPGVADQAPRGASGLHPARALPERGAGLPARAAAGPVDQPAHDAPAVGHPAALRRPVRDLRLVRRADQLRLGRSATPTARSTASCGRPITSSTSSARTS